MYLASQSTTTEPEMKTSHGWRFKMLNGNVGHYKYTWCLCIKRVGRNFKLSLFPPNVGDAYITLFFTIFLSVSQPHTYHQRALMDMWGSVKYRIFTNLASYIQYQRRPQTLCTYVRLVHLHVFQKIYITLSMQCGLKLSSWSKNQQKTPTLFGWSLIM